MNPKEQVFRSRWENGLSNEVRFWDGWLASRGGRWTEAYTKLLDPSRSLDSNLTALMDAPPGATVKLLDVGAGPITALSNQWEGRVVVTVAVDPLAHEYDRALKENGIEPKVRTQYGEAEQLSLQFQRDEFDLVYASNCIDHCYDPLKALREMVFVTKPGGYVVLEHAANEGLAERYEGLHQWNFDEEEHQFILWGPTEHVLVQEAVADICVVETAVREFDGNRKWLSTRLRKLRPDEAAVSVDGAERLRLLYGHLRRLQLQEMAAVREFGSPSRPDGLPLRYKAADHLNETLKRIPWFQGALKRAVQLVTRS